TMDARPSAGHTARSGTSSRSRTVRPWVIVAGVVLPTLISAIGVSAVMAGGTPQLSVTGKALPGYPVVANGTGIPGPTPVQRTWDGSALSMPDVTVDPSGRFSTLLRVPLTASPGLHMAAVVAPANASTGSGARLLATATVTVVTLSSYLSGSN